MKYFLKKFFSTTNNLDYISQNVEDLIRITCVDKIFEAINTYTHDGEIRFVGGCIRKIINKEKVDDIDLATNLEPQQVCQALKKKDIDYYETGIEHGTVTAKIGKFKFEITSLRKDVSTDGRHAVVEFSKNWREDASRRDFTINSIYSDNYGNLFDPYNGKKDLDEGRINFIGDVNRRINEDYLRILRYLRFFLNYSKQPHDSKVIKKLKINIGGVSNLSKERLLDELKKILKLEILEKLSKDKISIEILLMIFPEMKNINIFSKLSPSKKDILRVNDFIFLLSLIIIDQTDNVDYFLYRFNISKKDKKRIKIIDNFFKIKINSKTFNDLNLNKVFYYEGKQALIDILNFKIIKSKKIDANLMYLKEKYTSKEIPMMPIGADILMSKYNIPAGKQLGDKLKIIEREWVNNNFNISNKQIENIINN